MAGRATSYSDYYKNNDDTPDDLDPQNESKEQDPRLAARKAALKRRLLNKKKVGM